MSDSLPVSEGQIQVVDLLISGGNVVTMSDHLDPVIRNGSVAIRDDRIVDVGPTDDLRSRVKPRREIERPKSIIMPGIVDSYAHAGHGMVKGIHHQRFGWAANPLFFHATTPDWWRADAELLALERIKFGVTTGVSVLGATPARADDPVYADSHMAGMKESGIRNILGIGPPDDFIGNQWSATDWQGGTPRTYNYTFAECETTMQSVIAKWHGAESGRMRVCLAIPYLCGLDPQVMSGNHHYRYSPEDKKLLLERALKARQLADEHRVHIQTHGYRGTLSFGKEVFGMENLKRILGADVFFAHGHGFTPLDVTIMAESGANLSWVPLGPRGLDFGPPPIIELLKEGVDVAICSDGAAPFFVSDVFVNIHRALYLLWQRYSDMSLLPIGKSLRMVTRDAARILGMEDEIGSLDPGKKADLIVINTHQPHLTPTVAIPQLLTYYVRGNDVEMMVVDGQILMEDRDVKTLDEAKVLDQAQEEAERAFSRQGIALGIYLDMSPGHWDAWTLSLF